MQITLSFKIIYGCIKQGASGDGQASQKAQSLPKQRRAQQQAAEPAQARPAASLKKEVFKGGARDGNYVQ